MSREDWTMTPGVFMVINGIVIFMAIKLAFEVGTSGGQIGIGALVYFWISLYFYREWFRWKSNVRGMSDSVLGACLDEWESAGPFGRNVREITRVMHGSNLAKKARAARRLAEIYEELARREASVCPEVCAKLLLSERRWQDRANDLEQQINR